MRRRADKRDSNERPIITYLERCGYSVKQLSQDGVPDLAVGLPGYDINLFLEVKGESGTLTPSQVLFFTYWGGHKAVVRSIADTKKVMKQFMPVRIYYCEKCGGFEKREHIKSDPLTNCPTCGTLVKQVYTAPVIVFKGNGWAGKKDVQS